MCYPYDPDDGQYDYYSSKINEFYDVHGINVLGDPTDFLYPEEIFYDTEYHLNEEGKAIRTDDLLRMLQKQNISG